VELNTNKSPSRSLAHEPLLQLVGFRVGGEEFGIDILRVQEIIRAQQLTRVPNSPEFMEGVMNLRGKIIPVIALRKRFGLGQAPPDKQNRIVVVEIQGTVLGTTTTSRPGRARIRLGSGESRRPATHPAGCRSPHGWLRRRIDGHHRSTRISCSLFRGARRP
jgi:hypothetical protein